MIQRLMEVWAKGTAEARTHWRWVGYALTAAGLVYVLGILFFGGFRLDEVNWKAYWPASLASLWIYLLSLLVQFFIWVRLLSFHRPADWQDLEIYARMILARRLPGGIWHWVGRAAMYSATTTLPTQVVLVANFLEWGMLILVAVGVVVAGTAGSALGLRLIFAGLALGLAIALALTWQPRTRPWAVRLAEAGLWTVLYGVSWLLGGIILYLYVTAGGGHHLGWLEATRLWAVAGGVSLLITVVPAVFGIQEVTLTLILQSYLPPPIALLVAVLIRLIFTLADVVWGLAGWALSYAVIRGRTLPVKADR